jgi:hypothetical protein
MEVFLTQDAHKSQVRNNKGRATSRVLTVENEQAGRLSFSNFASTKWIIQNMKVQDQNFFYLAPHVSPSSLIEYDCTTPSKYGNPN